MRESYSSSSLDARTSGAITSVSSGRHPLDLFRQVDRTEYNTTFKVLDEAIRIAQRLELILNEIDQE